jgi:hypothetical protein
MKLLNVGPKVIATTVRLLDFAVVLFCAVTLLWWFSGEGLFYSRSSPVLSPFTSFSLLLMAGSRLADRSLETWPKTMTMALMGIVACGNISSIFMHVVAPELFFMTLPHLVPTSIFTSCGIIAFCFYEILVVNRNTPQNVFILDDILIHFALFPGGLSLVGHVLNIPAYISSPIDPRAGISYPEMALMGAYATVAVISNRHLFLWKFLSKGPRNVFIFSILFLNQYIAPIALGMYVHWGKPGPFYPGLELFVMIAGVLSTLVFLLIYASRSLRTTVQV